MALVADPVLEAGTWNEGEPRDGGLVLTMVLKQNPHRLTR